MKISDLARGEKSLYLSPGEIMLKEGAAATRAFPNAGNDMLLALALSASALRKNLAERTVERDNYRAELERERKHRHS